MNVKKDAKRGVGHPVRLVCVKHRELTSTTTDLKRAWAGALCMLRERGRWGALMGEWTKALRASRQGADHKVQVSFHNAADHYGKLHVNGQTGFPSEGRQGNARHGKRAREAGVAAPTHPGSRRPAAT
eukprot:352726-Chlamydomonas_euryale.AAC.4